MMTRDFCVFGILALTLSSVTGKKDEFPIFKEWTGKTPTNFMLLTAKQTENWGAAWPTDLKIILFGANTFGMKLDCGVKTLSEDAKLKSIRFCFNASGSSIKGNCKTVKDNCDIMNVNDAMVKLEFDAYNGGSATFSDVKPLFNVTSVFSCEVTNGRKTVTSNRIYFYDYRKISPNDLFPYLSKSDYWMTTSVLINGVALDLKSEVDFKKSVSSINSRFAKYLSPLELSVTPSNSSRNIEIQYQSENDNGDIDITTLLKVVPKPEIHKDDRPSNFTCSSCSSKERHVIKCVVTNKHLYDTSDNVEFRQFWRLGKQVLTEGKNLKIPVFNYVNISEDQSELTISKIGDEKEEIDFKKDINEGGITCVITLAYAKVPSDLSMKNNSVFFSTADDPIYDDMLVADIKFQLQPKPKTASLAWISAIVLSVLIVIIGIVLVIVWFRKRSPAETDNADIAEKRHGNPRELGNKELQELPVYQRPNSRLIPSQRASCDSKSIQVHVQSADGDDEDLANYFQGWTFNEDGSVIG